jgi:hypothetical protein
MIINDDVELWRDIDVSITWPSQHQYQISNNGTIRTYKRKWWWYPKPNIWTDWYTYMKFKQNPIQHTFKYSRIVARAFLWLDIYNRKIYVCHIDDNPINSKLDNLFLWDDETNKLDMYVKNRQPQWINHGASIYTESDIKHIYSLYNKGLNYNEIAKLTWITKSYVRVLCLWQAHENLFKSFYKQYD